MRWHAFGGGNWWSPFQSNLYDFRCNDMFRSGPSGGCGPQDSQSVVKKDVTAESALAVTIQGGADAFGRDTTVSADVNLRVVDRGLATFAFGGASFMAAAR